MAKNGSNLPKVLAIIRNCSKLLHMTGNCLKEFQENDHIWSRRESQKIKLRNFGHMSKVGLPYLPSTLVWTKKGLDKYSSVYPTYLSKKFGRFVIKVC